MDYLTPLKYAEKCKNSQGFHHNEQGLIGHAIGSASFTNSLAVFAQDFFVKIILGQRFCSCRGQSLIVTYTSEILTEVIYHVYA